ncbi:MAG: AAA family ATPase, partial [Flavobacteriaceae bacterium]|nr:AAA family ATPase [Flavobacteriaceae bacterium]
MKNTAFTYIFFGEGMDANDSLEKILKAIEDGKNIILYGPGGCGKTYTLRIIASHLKKIKKKVYCTATTGVAALNLNNPEEQISASTLHRWAGIGLARGSAKKICNRVQHDERSGKRWKYADALIIDEVSMLGASLFDKLDFIGKYIRLNNKSPFGGLQLILSGDFLQLPPVKDSWVFKSVAWSKLSLLPFVLETPKRYDDVNYFEMLLRIRKGLHNSSDIKKLRRRVKAYSKLLKILKDVNTDDVIKPTILYSKKINVNHHNSEELRKLPGDIVQYAAEDNFKAFKKKVNLDHYVQRLDDAIPKVLSFKVGAQVMLKCNLDVEGGLVNGSRGVVLAVEPHQLYVRFINGTKLKV